MMYLTISQVNSFTRQSEWQMMKMKTYWTTLKQLTSLLRMPDRMDVSLFTAWLVSVAAQQL